MPSRGGQVGAVEDLLFKPIEAVADWQRVDGVVERRVEGGALRGASHSHLKDQSSAKTAVRDNRRIDNRKPVQ